MASEKIDTLIIGGGQAGLAMSEHLGKHNVEHLVLERHRIAERWRTERWNSLVANGPAWHDRFPTLEFENVDPDAFATKDDVVAYLEQYAAMNGTPIRTGVDVTEITLMENGAFRAVTSDGVIEANNVVAATGPFQRPLIPTVVPDKTGIEQLHSNAYKEPAQLPDGAVLVVGAGSSGSQIAEEIARTGKRVYLSIGPHDRPPRAYRGKDFVWWLGVLGKWGATEVEPGKEHVTIAVSGAYGGHTVDFRDLADQGITLLGRAGEFRAGVLHFASDLRENIENGDRNYLSVLEEADAHVRREGLDMPEEPEAKIIGPLPDCVTGPVLELDLKDAGISSIIWATGFALDFNWLKVGTYNEDGRPSHNRGVTDVPGLYFLGLPWLSCRASAFIWGVWVDAKYLAEHIVSNRTDG